MFIALLSTSLFSPAILSTMKIFICVTVKLHILVVVLVLIPLLIIFLLLLLLLFINLLPKISFLLSYSLMNCTSIHHKFSVVFLFNFLEVKNQAEISLLQSVGGQEPRKDASFILPSIRNELSSHCFCSSYQFIYQKVLRHGSIRSWPTALVPIIKM